MTVVVPRILIEARRWKIGASKATAANSRHPEYGMRRTLTTAMTRLSTSDRFCFLVFIVFGYRDQSSLEYKQGPTDTSE